MKNSSAKVLLLLILFFLTLPFYTQEKDSSIYMDFRNQKISDIIYSVADVCGKSVIIDETVSGNATFRFEDKDFESALNRFAEHCQLYVEKNDDVYFVTKVKIATNNDEKLSISALQNTTRTQSFLQKLHTNIMRWAKCLRHLTQKAIL